MAVHDMRNPTNQIEYLLKESLQKLNDLEEQLEQLKKISKDFGKDNRRN